MSPNDKSDTSGDDATDDNFMVSEDVEYNVGDDSEISLTR